MLSASAEQALAQLPSQSLESNIERVIDRFDPAEYDTSDDLFDQINDQEASANGPTTAGVSLQLTPLPR